jgi:hypothetical protein
MAERPMMARRGCVAWWYSISFAGSQRRNYAIMRPEQYGPQAVADLLERQQVATMTDLQKALGTPSRTTVFRKLGALGYLTSYSHRGKYYTLEALPRFDSQGLWSHRDIRFSRVGTLMATAELLVTQSEGGYFVCELDRVLHVSTKKALQTLVVEDRLSREKVSGWYVYCAPDAGARREQLRARKILEAELILAHGLREPQVSTDELKTATILVYSSLDEKQRRLCAGLESLRLGYGGDRKVADLLGMNVHTVAKGRKELLAEDLDLDRVRRSGGGRMSIKKKLLK